MTPRYLPVPRPEPDELGPVEPQQGLMGLFKSRRRPKTLDVRLEDVRREAEAIWNDPKLAPDVQQHVFYAIGNLTLAIDKARGRHNDAHRPPESF